MADVITSFNLRRGWSSLEGISDRGHGFILYLISYFIRVLDIRSDWPGSTVFIGLQSTMVLGFGNEFNFG